MKKLEVSHVKCTFYKQFYDYHEKGKDMTFQEHYNDNDNDININNNNNNNNNNNK